MTELRFLVAMTILLFWLIKDTPIRQVNPNQFQQQIKEQSK